MRGSSGCALGRARLLGLRRTPRTEDRDQPRHEDQGPDDLVQMLANHRQVAEEIETHRVCLMAKAPAGTNPLRTLEAFKEFYPGKKSNITIEQNLVMDWSKGPYASGCERFGFSELGALSKYWPHIMTPQGRIHFAGGHTDNRTWGMEAATNSANRVAIEIDKA